MSLVSVFLIGRFSAFYNRTFNTALTFWKKKFSKYCIKWKLLYLINSFMLSIWIALFSPGKKIHPRAFY